ncbi:multidrug resistance efflux pump [Pedobacter cryoconitis]|uniref:Multidrug resistance efflux pump n=1 Tax=Pedobacter cryoconitis TaxID=188932 RepID=A0A7W9DY47_9SPHI|nr:HlyD family secretion protein [Pedobacter cryoconitis]MBB5634854.1 multidrug resistance efflux pump [Pedobacter cryoconitis]MBB6272013.1 multidrug resistance efflux pump [Pedobacter cryoconitis]
MEKHLKLIEKERNNVAGKAERWIFSWGIILISILLSICMLFILVTPHRDDIFFNARFHTQHKIIPVISPYSGIIKKDVFDTNNAIKPNTFLFTIFDLSAQKETSVYAKEAGYYMPNKIKFRSKTYVSKNDTLFYIMPDIKNKDEIYCTADADQSAIEKLSIGDQVLINIESYGENSDVSGTISSIAKKPDQSGKYPFQISLDYKDIRNLSEKGIFYFDQQGKARVKFKPQKLAYKLLNLL